MLDEVLELIPSEYMAAVIRKVKPENREYLHFQQLISQNSLFSHLNYNLKSYHTIKHNS